MSIIELLLKEMDQEASTTRRMLERVPGDKFDFKPHPKSMRMQSLVTHIAELPAWVTMALTTDGHDFEATPYQPVDICNTAQLLEYFEKNLEDGRSHLAEATEEQLTPTWILRSGSHIHGVYTKYEMIRHAFSQIIHHRAQLGVYLRLLSIPIPGSYGPSADEMNF